MTLWPVVALTAGTLMVCCLLWVSHLLLRATTILNRLEEKVTVGSATSDRTEAAGIVVAEDLAASQARADAAERPHGAAADAGSRTKQ